MPRVLIADDNVIIRNALSTVFSQGDDQWRVCGMAQNGAEAVEMAAKLKPDVVLLDFLMPVMNGLEAAKEITKSHPSIAIAMYTLHQNPIFEKQARACGVRKVISKTEIFSALIPSLQAILGKSAPSAD